MDERPPRLEQYASRANFFAVAGLLGALAHLRGDASILLGAGLFVSLGFVRHDFARARQWRGWLAVSFLLTFLCACRLVQLTYPKPRPGAWIWAGLAGCGLAEIIVLFMGFIRGVWKFTGRS